MTLKEFGNKIKEVYPLYSNTPCWITVDDMTIQLWLIKPEYSEIDKCWENLNTIPKELFSDIIAMFIYNPFKDNLIDLSEYGITKQGKDFSKCIEELN